MEIGRDWLMPPTWRSAIKVERPPVGAVHIADDDGWRYWRHNAKIYVTR